jgi:NitT/TauT family transport system permease protein
VFFVVYLAVFSGMRQAEARFVEHARLLGARPLDIVREVYVPSILGWLFASLRLALGFAFSGAVIGELLGSSRGLGYLVNAASGRFDPAGILAVVFVILLIIGLAFAALSSVERRTLRWRASETASVG